MQILGLGAIMLVLTVAVWGWRMMTHRPFDREALRLGSWILCTVIAAGFVSCWPHGGAWPLPTGCTRPSVDPWAWQCHPVARAGGVSVGTCRSRRGPTTSR